MAKQTIASLSTKMSEMEDVLSRMIDSVQNTALATQKALESHQQVLNYHDSRLSAIEDKLIQLESKTVSAPKTNTGKSYPPAYSKASEIPLNSYGKQFSDWSTAYPDLVTAKQHLADFQAKHPGKPIILARCKAGFCWAF